MFVGKEGAYPRGEHLGLVGSCLASQYYTRLNSGKCYSLHRLFMFLNVAVGVSVIKHFPSSLRRVIARASTISHYRFAMYRKWIYFVVSYNVFSIVSHLH
jgi:hypothetical protein